MSQMDEERNVSAPPTSEEVIGKVNESITALQAAQQTVVEGAKLLGEHVNDAKAHGAAVQANIEAAMPRPVWEGTSLKFEQADGTVVSAAVDLKGPQGGPPEHKWDGTALALRHPDGTWGTPMDLKGPKGEPGPSATPLSNAVNSTAEDTAASSLAVKTAYDKAQEALESAQANNSWSGLAGKPDAFPPGDHAASHKTDGSDPLTPEAIGALPADGTAVKADSVPWSGVSGKPSTFAPSLHAASHGSGGTDRLTPADIGALPANGKAAGANTADIAMSVPWSGVSGKPAAFDPAPHAATHAANGADPITAASIGALPSTGKAVSAGTADSATMADNAVKWNGSAKTVSSAAPSGGADNDVWLQYI